MTGLIVLLVVLAIVAWVVLGHFTLTGKPKQVEPEPIEFDFPLDPNLGPVRAERIVQAERDKAWAEHMRNIS